MPRNGAGIFSLDARYLVSEGDTILPSQHNPVLEDLQTDANTPRPIVAGGTGASTATTARTNLSVYSIADVDDGFTPKVAARTALKALDTATTKAVVLTEASRQKLFMWMTGDYTDSVAGDPSELAYIPADGIDPALGCWVAVTGAGASIVPVIQGGTGANDAATALDNLGGMASATYDPNSVAGDAFDMANMVEATDAKIMTAAERADLAKATLNDDTDVSGNSWVLAEDDMASDSDTKVPTQQSVKAKIDNDTILKVADRTALKAVDTAKHTVVYLRESGREGQFVWNSSNLSAEVAADTNENTYVAANSDTTGASGAWVRKIGGYVPLHQPARIRSVQERLSEGIFLDDFTGATDTDKLLDFASSGEGYVRLPSRSMTVESGIVIDQDVSPHVEIAGASTENTQIVYTGTEPELFKIKRLGVVNALADHVGFHLRDMHLVAGSDNVATAIAADLDGASSGAGSYEAYRRRVSRIVLTAQDTTKAWAAGVRLTNSSYALIDDLLFRSVNQKGNAVYITGTKDNVSNVIRHLKVVSANKGVYCDSDYTEGTSIFEPDIIATNRAVEFDGSINNPQLVVSGGHMNILEYGIKTRNITSVIASDLLIYALQAGSIGVSINDEDVAFIRGHSFTNVDIFGNSDAAARGYEFTGSTRTATINGGSVTGFSGGVGVDIASGCTEIYVDPSVQFRSNGSDFVSASDTCRVQVLNQSSGVMSRRIPEIRDYIASTGISTHATYKSRGTINSPTIVQSGDILRKEEVKAWDGTQYVSAGYIQWTVDQTPGTGDMPTRFSVFVSNDGVASPQERFAIRRNGAPIMLLPPTTGALDANGQVTIEFTNDTTLTFKARGSDGTTRTATLTLA